MPRPLWESRLIVLCVLAAIVAIVWLPASLALMGVWVGTLDKYLLASAWGLDVFAVAVGSLSLGAGVVGSQLGSGARCAKCGYDVSGSLSLDNPACPECGLTLGRHTAVATKRWIPRRELALAGLAALLVSAGPTVVVRASSGIERLIGATFFELHQVDSRPDHPLAPTHSPPR